MWGSLFLQKDPCTPERVAECRKKGAHCVPSPKSDVDDNSAEADQPTLVTVTDRAAVNISRNKPVAV